jgi:glucosamine--fructose-6-phosphate aminotransferase (isomerizing)
MNDKRTFAHHMLSEIHQQPRTIRDTLAGRLDLETGTVVLETLPVRLSDLASVAWIRIAASGTSRYASLFGKFAIEALAGIPVEVEYASELELHRSSFSPPLTIVTSQSGETADTLATLRRAKREGSRTLAICNVEDSSMMREADSSFHIKAGPELSIPSTKAFGGQLTYFLLLALGLAQARQSMEDCELHNCVLELALLPDKLETVLGLENRCAEIADRYFQIPDFIFFGRGPHYPIALDGALKLKEAAYIHAEGYPGGELKHGQITQVDDQMVAVVLATADRGESDSFERYRRQLDTAKEIRALSGHVIVLASEGDQIAAQVADEILYLPVGRELLLPLLEIVPLQMLAYFVAVRRGLNPDRPRNLRKAVVSS